MLVDRMKFASYANNYTESAPFMKDFMPEKFGLYYSTDICGRLLWLLWLESRCDDMVRLQFISSYRLPWGFYRCVYISDGLYYCYLEAGPQEMRYINFKSQTAVLQLI